MRRLLTVCLVFCAMSSTSSASVSWQVSDLQVEQIPGTVQKVTVVFSSDTQLTDVSVWVVPELAAFVRCDPCEFQSVPPAQPTTVELYVSLPRLTSIGDAYSGTIHLRKGSTNATLARPLPLTVTAVSPYDNAASTPAAVVSPSADRISREPDLAEEFVNDELNIWFRQGVTGSAIDDFVHSLGGVFLGSVPRLNFYQIRVSPTDFLGLMSLVHSAKQNPIVAAANLNMLSTPSAFPNDPYAYLSYAIPVLRLAKAWDITRGEPTWQKSTAYVVGDYVVPTTANGHRYRCTTGGTSAALEPTPWGTTAGWTTTDGGVTWTLEGEPKGEAIRIGVIDTVFDSEHADLAENIACLIDANTKTGNCSKQTAASASGSFEQHGTRVASIVGAVGNNEKGIAGAMWHTSLYLCSASTPERDKLLGSNQADCIADMIKRKVKVVNWSVGTACHRLLGFVWCTDKDLANIQNSVDYWGSAFQIDGADILWVVAAGNNHQPLSRSMARVASLPNVVAVPAVDIGESLASFSDYGSEDGESWKATGLIAAPGVEIYSDIPGGGDPNVASGTSFAAPHVTGVAGLMLSKNRDLSATQLKSILQASTRQPGGFDPAGNAVEILDAQAAVQAAASSGSSINRIAFHRTGPLSSDACGGLCEDIWSVNPDGSDLKQHTTHPRQDFDPAWSPDHSKLAFVSHRDQQTDIYVMDVDSGNPVPLGIGLPCFDPAWSPDGTQIAFTAIFPGWNYGLGVINADGTGGLRKVVDAFWPDPDWSPDGTKIAFGVSEGLRSLRGIWVVAPNGTGLTRLYPEEDPSTSYTAYGSPVWSPDGTRIVFSTAEWDDWNNPVPIPLYVMNADGTNVTKLTNPGPGEFYPERDLSPSWSPDGTKIVFYRLWNPPRGSQLIIIDAVTGSPERFLDMLGRAGQPSWR